MEQPSNPTDLSQRIAAQQHITREMGREALATLGKLIDLPPTAPEQLDASYAAASVVAKALHLELQKPRNFDDLPSPNEGRIDPFERIAQASQVRCRIVRLQPGWWQQDCGPLLGHLRADQSPVALLPSGKGRWECFEPGTGQQYPVTADNEASFERRTWMYYRPLPYTPLNAWELLRFALADRWGDLGRLLLIGLFSTILGMASIQAIGLIVDHAIPDADRLSLAQIAIGLLLVGGGLTLAEAARSILSMRTETGADHVLQSAAWDRLLRLRLPFFHKYSAGDVLTRVSGVNGIRQALSGTTLRTLFASFFGLLNLGLLCLYSTQLALLAFLIALVMGVVTIAAALFLLRDNAAMLALDGKMMGSTVQLLQMVPKLRVAAAEERAFAFWMKLYLSQKQIGLRIQAIQDWVGIINAVIGLVATMVMFSVALPLTQGTLEKPALLTTGMLMAVLTAYWAFLGCAGDLSGAVTRLLQIVNLWNRVEPILTAKPETNVQRQSVGTLRGAVRVEGLSFRYGTDGPLVLRDVSLHAEPGEFIAIAGASGGGKSTLLRLLLGFESPEQGRILFDGQDLIGLDLDSLRKQFGVVLQNGKLQQGSLYENIAGGALIGFHEAEEAAHAAGLGDDLTKLPMGLHTMVSEGGTNLSGGQRQRVLIARALASRPRILLFDEATSALDNRTQAQVTQHLKKLEITRIVIAHRLSTIRQADRIYVVDKGRVVQRGTYDELAALPGIFAQFVARQQV